MGNKKVPRPRFPGSQSSQCFLFLGRFQRCRQRIGPIDVVQLLRRHQTQQ